MGIPEVNSETLLVIGPVPPPHTGNSLPVSQVIKDLGENFKIVVVNLNKPSHRSGFDSFGRVYAILRCAVQVFWLGRNADRVYLTLAESRAGNLRDVLFYILLVGRLRRVTAHLFGGANYRLLVARERWLTRKVNGFFISRLGAVVVEGNMQRKIFDGLATERRIHVVSNFAEDFLFADISAIENKYRERNIVRVLFLSNMLPGKGHLELVRAYIAMSPAYRSKVRLTLAGKMVCPGMVYLFKSGALDRAGIEYVGSVSGEVKKNLFRGSHIFCLPTYYPYEGQPFSIIEAYASGCAVITTLHSGIVDIFTDGVNGRSVSPCSVESIVEVIGSLPDRLDEFRLYSLRNISLARNLYSQSIFTAKMRDVIVNCDL